MKNSITGKTAIGITLSQNQHASMHTTNNYFQTLNSITMRKKYFLLCLAIFTGMATVSAAADGLPVKGQVTDENGTPLAGVAVFTDDMSAGTTTSADGTFRMEVPSENSTLTFSCLGYNDVRQKVGMKSDFLITMEESNSMLDEVVVVGFGTQLRKDIVGSIASVSADEIRSSGESNVLESLQGSVPGLRIDIPSSPTAEPAVRVRGLNSLSSDNTPLYIVDGVPYEDMQSLNPNDIQSVEVLKDASAAAIYGSRAANGVILITTNRSRGGETIVNASFTYSMQNLAKDPDLMTGAEYIAYKMECARTKGTSTEIADLLTGAEYQQYLKGLEIDPFKMMTHRNAPMYEASLSVQGGDDVRYYVGANYTDRDGLVRGTGFQRVSIRSNLDADLGKYVTLSNSTNIYQKDSDDIDGGDYGLGAMYRLSPYSVMYNEDGTHAISPMADDPLFGNPMSDAYDIPKMNRTRGIGSITTLKVDIPHVQGLSVSGKFAFDWRNWTLGRYAPETTKEGQGAATATRKYTNTSKWYAEALVAYRNNFGKHNIDLTAMFSAESREQEGQNQEASGLSTDDYLWYQPETASNPVILSTSYNLTRNVGMMFRANYNYDNRYYATFTVRRDAFSGFSENMKWATFPSGAVAWRISEEDFLKGVRNIDNLKLRVSYGELGNQAISAYETLAKISNEAAHTFGKDKYLGYKVSSLPSSLKWETTATLNVGLDFGFFSNRLFGSVEWYNSITRDLLVERSIPSMLGQASMWTNSCKVQNTGFEVSLTGVPVQTKNWEWSVGVNFSYDDNNILEIYGEKKDDTGNKWFIGQPIGVVYTQKCIGIWQQDEAEEAAKYGCEPGYPKIEDIGGGEDGGPDGKIDDNDRQIIGTTVPPYLLGLRTSLRWKDLTLTIVANGAFGHVKQASYKYLDDGRFRNFNITGYWTPENPSNTHMRPGINPEYTGSLYVYKADWFKIKNITLSYNLPAKLLERQSFIRSCQFYVTMQDWFSFYDFPFVDPETGTDIGSYPSAKQFKLGVNISF